MKTISITILLTATLSVFTNIVIAESLRPVRLVTLLDFKPFVWCENGNPTGTDIDIIDELFSRAGRKVTIECLPWNRAIHYTKNGKADGLFSAYMTEERKEFATYLKYPMHTSTFSVFVRNGSDLKFTSIENLHGLNIGISRGYSINPEFDAAKMAGKFEVYESISTEKGISLLLKGRIDAYVNGRLVVLNRARNMGVIGKISELPHPVHTPKPAFLIISKESNLPQKKELIQSLNQELKKMSQDGTTSKIINRYIQYTPQ